MPFFYCPFVLDPLLPRVANALYGALGVELGIPAPPRADLLPLVTYAPPIADLLRLSVAVPATPVASASRLGFVGDGNPASLTRAASHPENRYELATALRKAGMDQEADQEFPTFEKEALGESKNVDNANRELTA